jgi:hypothetical protein
MARRARVRYRLGVTSNRAIVRWLAPAALAVLVMLPRLASPQFGMLDDGLTLQTGHQTVGRWSSVVALIPETGRFFPAYWLVYSAVVGVVGVRPLAFFVFNVLVLAGLLSLLAQLVQLSGGTPRQAFVAAVLFATCGPTIEAFYTLSKAEPLQMIWIAVSLLVSAAAAREPRRWRRAGLIALAAAALMLGYATKETSVVLIPISLAWLAIDWSSRRLRPCGTPFAIIYAAVNIGAAATFFALRWRYAALTLAEGTYTRAYTFDVETLGPALFRIAAWVIRDFVFLIPLCIAAVAGFRSARPEWRRGCLYACAWMGGWLGVWAPWPATFEYYLLPFAFGAAVFAGLVIGGLWAGRTERAPRARRRLAWSALAATALLWVPGIVNAATDGRVQLAVDRANADLVDFLAGLPLHSRVVLNTVYANEYLYELPIHLAEIKRRPDLVVQHVGLFPAGSRPPASVFVVTPMMANQPGPTVRIAVYEAGVRRDSMRLHEMLSGGGDLVYTTERHVRLLEVSLHRHLCRLAGRPFVDVTFCAGERGVVDGRRFTYGWRVHRLSRPAVELDARPT